jgi:hypothetical protein
MGDPQAGNPLSSFGSSPYGSRRFALRSGAGERAMSTEAQVREAVARIQPLPGKGPNFFTVDVEGWWISAPTTLELKKMLWDWFNPRPSVAAHIKAVEALLDSFEGAHRAQGRGR